MDKKVTKNKNKHKINNDIRCLEVRLVGYYEEPKVLKTQEAQKIANSEEKDLILINENQNPPVVKIMDYKKFLYDTEKADKERKKNSIKSILKEIQLSPEIAENDLKVKSKKAIEFLKNGDKVKCSMILKGRQQYNPERGEITMLKFATLIEDFGILESMPTLQGNKWNMMVKPKKKS
jgi:translation initiation factor IF-3